MPSVLFKAYRPDGELYDAAPTSGYLTDTDYEPFRADVKVEGGVLKVTAEPRRAFFLHCWWEVPDFGRVQLWADAAGRGYRCAETIDLSLDLNVELAHSRLAAVERRAADVGAEPEGDFRKRRAEAQELLAAADAADNEADRARLATQALTAACWAGEMLEQAKARADIAERGTRSGPGRPPGFLFGANAFGLAKGERYTSLFEGLLNFGTVPFYWGGFEPEEGKPNYTNADRITDWLTGAGLTAKGHPLVWFFPQTTPDWQKTKTYDEMKQLCVDRVRTIVSRYRGRIDIWDIINEAHDWANVFHYTHEQMIDVVRAISAAARDANPDCIRIVNNCCLWAEYVASGNTMQGHEDRELWSPYRFLRALEDAGVDYDVIGLQIYYPSRDLFEINRLLDQYATLGKPIHITELGTPSKYEDDPNSHFRQENAVRNMGWWHAPWTQDIQADWIEQFYTICYSKPYIDAITWWDFSDHGGHFFPWSGFVDENLEPKASYHRLKQLFTSWAHA